MIRLQLKIKSFTLTELLVVLAISAIVIGLGYTAFSVLSRYTYGIQKNLRQSTENHLLEQQLQMDFYRYPETLLSENQDKLVFKSPIDSVSYVFYDTYAIRAEDTIALVISQMQFYNNGNITQSGSVDALKIEEPDTLGAKKLFIFKRNDGLSNMRDEN